MDGRAFRMNDNVNQLQVASRLELKKILIANLPIEGLVSTDRSMVAALLNTTPRPVTKSSANDSTPRP